MKHLELLFRREPLGAIPPVCVFCGARAEGVRIHRHHPWCPWPRAKREWRLFRKVVGLYDTTYTCLSAVDEALKGTFAYKRDVPETYYRQIRMLRGLDYRLPGEVEDGG